MSNNPYYGPKKFGLTPVAEIEYSSGSFEFDTRVVWRGENGKLYTARDSGCSCPTPFEDYGTLESLDTFDMASLREEVDAALKRSYGCQITPLQAKAFLNAVEAAIPPSQHA